MPEAEVVYSDVRFTASREKSKETFSQPETTYDEIKTLKTPPEAPSSPAETTRPPAERSEAAGRRSKVTERALLLVLCSLLVAATVGLCLVSIDNSTTRKQLAVIQVKVKYLENLTVVNSSIPVKPTCLNESQLQACVNENEALRKKLTAKLCGTCEPDWEQHGGSCYHFSTSTETWNQSRNDCKSRGADLVQIDSEEEQRFLNFRVTERMKNNEDKFWIGLTDAKEEGRWLWVDDSPQNTSWQFWSQNEPDNYTGVNPAGEDCVRMGIEGGAKDLMCWFDRECEAPQKRICEKAAETGQ